MRSGRLVWLRPRPATRLVNKLSRILIRAFFSHERMNCEHETIDCLFLQGKTHVSCCPPRSWQFSPLPIASFGLREVDTRRNELRPIHSITLAWTRMNSVGLKLTDLSPRSIHTQAF